jgi:hypothetical protein
MSRRRFGSRVPSGMAPFQGLGMCGGRIPRALPWAVLRTPFRRTPCCIINAFQAGSGLRCPRLSGGVTGRFERGTFSGHGHCHRWCRWGDYRPSDAGAGAGDDDCGGDTVDTVCVEHVADLATPSHELATAKQKWGFESLAPRAFTRRCCFLGAPRLFRAAWRGCTFLRRCLG